MCVFRYIYGEPIGMRLGRCYWMLTRHSSRFRAPGLLRE
jgi:hypothetical protein